MSHETSDGTLYSVDHCQQRSSESLDRLPLPTRCQLALLSLYALQHVIIYTVDQCSIDTISTLHKLLKLHNHIVSYYHYPTSRHIPRYFFGICYDLRSTMSTMPCPFNVLFTVTHRTSTLANTVSVSLGVRVILLISQ